VARAQAKIITERKRGARSKATCVLLCMRARRMKFGCDAMAPCGSLDGALLRACAASRTTPPGAKCAASRTKWTEREHAIARPHNPPQSRGRSSGKPERRPELQAMEPLHEECSPDARHSDSNLRRHCTRPRHHHHHGIIFVDEKAAARAARLEPRGAAAAASRRVITAAAAAAAAARGSAGRAAGGALARADRASAPSAVFTTAARICSAGRAAGGARAR